jgi:hypothetical protein
MRFASWFVGLVLLLGGPCWLPASVVAQPVAAGSPQGQGAQESAEYTKLIDAALLEYEGHNFSEARALFARAHALAPSARTLRGLGMAEFEQRRYPEAIDYLEQALSSTVKPLDEALRRHVQDLLTRARYFVAKLHIDVTPPHAQLQLDGQPVVPNPDGLTVQAGSHLLEASARNYLTDKRQFSVQGGEEQTMRISLNAAVQATETATASTSLVRSPWLWTGVGVVAVGLGIAAVFLLRPSPRQEIGAVPTSLQTPVGAQIQALSFR